MNQLILSEPTPAIAERARIADERVGGHLRVRSGTDFIVLCCVLLVSVCLRSNAAQGEATFESGEGQTNLIELYTSEGCSSCPPAEVWLGNLRNTPGLWSSFVPVAFHVDYWNNLGWPDRFSSPEFTARQRAYAGSWKSASVYTPAFVLNGAEWRRPGEVPTSADTNPGRLRVSLRASGDVDVTFDPVVTLKGPFRVAVVPLAMGVTTNVKRGENSGRTLRHDFLALGISHGALAEVGGGEWKGRIALPTNPEAACSALAVWIYSPEKAVVQATGGLIGEASATR